MFVSEEYSQIAPQALKYFLLYASLKNKYKNGLSAENDMRLQVYTSIMLGFEKLCASKQQLHFSH